MELFISVGIIIIIGLMAFVVIKLLARPAASNSDDTARAQAQADAYKQQLEAAQLELRATRVENQSLLQERTQLAEREALARQTTTTTLQRLEEATAKFQQLSDQHQQAINRAEKAELEVRHHQDLCQKETAKLKAKIEEHEALQKAHNDKCTEFATVEGQLKNLQKQLDDRESSLKKEIEQLQQTFKVSVNELVDQKARALKEDSKQSVAELLSPVKEKLTEFATRVETLNADSAKQHGSLAEHLLRVEQLNQTLSQEASALAQALRGDAKVMGDWGELTLERVLQSSALDQSLYIKQAGLKAREGDEGRLVADIIVKLPDGRHLVIDSKVSLVAYVDYQKAQSKQEQDAAGDRLKSSIRAHISKLAKSEYHARVDSPEFTLMFIPYDPILSLILQMDEQLVAWAHSQKVMIVTPSTLVLAIKVVHELWQRDKSAANQQEIVRLAGVLYQKVNDGLVNLKSVGDRLKAAQASFDEAFGQLASGKGNLIVTAEKMSQMGIQRIRNNKSLKASLPEQYQGAIADDGVKLIEIGSPDGQSTEELQSNQSKLDSDLQDSSLDNQQDEEKLKLAAWAKSQGF